MALPAASSAVNANRCAAAAERINREIFKTILLVLGRRIGVVSDCMDERGRTPLAWTAGVMDRALGVLLENPGAGGDQEVLRLLL
jgi:hypothetical protein